MSINNAGTYTRGTYTVLQIPLLILKAFYYRAKASGKLPGHVFDAFGRRISFRFLLNGKSEIFLRLLCNPVSIVRYFEFSFVADHVPWNSVTKALDVSSPRLLFLYLLQKFPGLCFDIINPDGRDIQETRDHLDVLGLHGRSNVLPLDVMNVPFPDNSYDVVTSVSVLEHIPGDDDTRVLRKLWGLLKEKGRLVITIPCGREYGEEWRSVDMYGLGYPMRDGKYFFQRIYDMPTVKKRIIEVIGTEPATMQVFGEKTKGTYAEYEKRWISLGLPETVKDPFHIASEYRHFQRLEDLEGMGVCGMIFEKGA